MIIGIGFDFRRDDVFFINDEFHEYCYRNGVKYFFGTYSTIEKWKASLGNYFCMIITINEEIPDTREEAFEIIRKHVPELLL